MRPCMLLFSICLCFISGDPLGGQIRTPARLIFDQGHGEQPPPRQLEPLAKNLGLEFQTAPGPITEKDLEGVRILYLRAPSQTFTLPEIQSIRQFVNGGGSLLLVLDEEERQSLEKTRANDLISPFGMKLTPDTAYLPNTGAIAKAGEINKVDREVPYDGGRAVEGGTAFAFQLDKNDKPAQPYAAYKRLENGGRIVVLAEGMASLFLGDPNGVRLSGGRNVPTTYWGKDSAIFMKEVLAWLAGVSPDVATGIASPAPSPFIGEWKLDPSKSRMPDEMKVQSKGGNRYAFDFGVGAETIVVDGSDQPGYGGTMLSVKAEAPDTWVVQRKKDGRLLITGTWKLSQDGSQLTDYFREFESDGSTLSMDYVYQRTGAGSGFAADWESIKETMNSPFLIQVKEFQGDGLSFVTPSEQKTRNVKFDGKDYPNEGPNAGRGASSSIRQVDERTLVITDKHDGKVTDTEEIGISTDLKTLTITVHIAGRDKPNVLVFERK